LKTQTIKVNVSAEQLRLFEVLAKEIGATPGEVMLSLASDHLGGNPVSAVEFPDSELMSLCWKFAHRRELPDAGQWLSTAQMKLLGYQDAVEVGHA
jgi:hypothetical protein